MSFTEQVKNELARVVRPDKESRSGELLALLRMGGAIVTGAQGKKGVEFSTGNSAVARRVLVCLKKDFNLMPSAMVRQGRKLRKKNVYTLTVRPSADSLRFLGEMGLDPLMDIRDAGRLVSAEERRRRRLLRRRLSAGRFPWRRYGEPAAGRLSPGIGDTVAAVCRRTHCRDAFLQIECPYDRSKK